MRGHIRRRVDASIIIRGTSAGRSRSSSSALILWGVRRLLDFLQFGFNYMNVMKMLSIWRKRWILTALVILVAFAASGFAAVKLPRTYQADSTVVLVPSARAAKALGEGNPYLSFNASLSTAADVIATEVAAPQTEQDLASKGFGAQYAVVSESTTGQAVASSSVLPGPFVAVYVTGTNRNSVEHTLYGVTAAIRSEVSAMQSGMTRNNRISVSTISYAPRASLSMSMTARSLVLIVGLLTIGALCIPLIVDAQVARRRLRRSPDLAPGPYPVATEAGVPERQSGRPAKTGMRQDRRQAARL